MTAVKYWSAVLFPREIDGDHGAPRSDLLAHGLNLSESKAVQIELAKTVAAKPALAFDILADVTDWPQIIRSIRSVEVLTPGPIRPGTRLREDRIMLGRETTQEMEITTIDSPRRLRLLADQPDLSYELDHLIDSVHGGGCRLMLIFRSRPTTLAGRAVHAFMTPFMGVTLRDELEQDLADLAAAISARGS